MTFHISPHRYHLNSLTLPTFHTRAHSPTSDVIPSPSLSQTPSPHALITQITPAFTYRQRPNPGDASRGSTKPDATPSIHTYISMQPCHNQKRRRVHLSPRHTPIHLLYQAASSSRTYRNPIEILAPGFRNHSRMPPLTPASRI